MIQVDNLVQFRQHPCCSYRRIGLSQRYILLIRRYMYMAVLFRAVASVPGLSR